MDCHLRWSDINWIYDIFSSLGDVFFHEVLVIRSWWNWKTKAYLDVVCEVYISHWKGEMRPKASYCFVSHISRTQSMSGAAGIPFLSFCIWQLMLLFFFSLSFIYFHWVILIVFIKSRLLPQHSYENPGIRSLVSGCSLILYRYKRNFSL